MKAKTVLITGASSGLGLAVAKRLYESGHTVYAGARSYKTPETLPPSVQYKGTLHRVYMDVTLPGSIDDVIRSIVDKEGGLDALVNCAARLVLGSVEDTGVEEYRRVMDTNFIGTLNACKSAMAVMRRQGRGLIVNFSSLNGILGIPFQSAYVSSKFAVEGLSECLSLEAGKFGIKVVLIEPGDHRSGSKAYRPHAVNAASEGSPYRRDFATVTEKIERDEENGSDPAGVARLVDKLLSAKKPGLRYTVGSFDQRLSAMLKRLLPGRMFEKIILSYYNIK